MFKQPKRTPAAVRATPDDGDRLPDDDRLIDVPAWAELTGISHRTAKRLLARGAAPPLTVLPGVRRSLIRLSDFRAWLSTLPRHAASAQMASRRDNEPSGRAHTFGSSKRKKDKRTTGRSGLAAR
jgi:predicted DNA-binding transcriptional regulator AlpA